MIRRIVISAFILCAMPAMAATGWGSLSNWIGHYPDEKLGPAGAQLLGVPAIHSTLRHVLPAADFQALSNRYKLADQVSQVGHYILVDYCTAHDCGASNVTIVLDQTSANLWVAFFSSKGSSVSTRWYGTADYADLPANVQNAVIAVHRPAN
ncbi:hypothetical protein [Acidocella facilis]|uniref:hypothetical protein n=1 Tax=Acidocella facilis TaxID=525 RepID=UPI000478C6EF|nr:hypothetical protein [Acidocella facilis]